MTFANVLLLINELWRFLFSIFIDICFWCVNLSLGSVQGHKAAIEGQQNFLSLFFIVLLLLNFRFILEILEISVILFVFICSDQRIVTTRRRCFMPSLLILLEQRCSLLSSSIRCMPIVSAWRIEWTRCFLPLMSCEHFHTVHIVRISNVLTNAIDRTIWLQRPTTVVRCLLNVALLLFLILRRLHFPYFFRGYAALFRLLCI